jgi:hypothetical protein
MNHATQLRRRWGRGIQRVVLFHYCSVARSREIINAGYSTAASFRLDHDRAGGPTPRLVSPLD